MERVENSNNPNETIKKYGAASWIWGLYCIDNDNLGIRFMKNLTGEGVENPVSFMLTTNGGELLKESSDVEFIEFNEYQTNTFYSPNRNADAPNSFIKMVLSKN